MAQSTPERNYAGPPAAPPPVGMPPIAPPVAPVVIPIPPAPPAPPVQLAQPPRPITIVAAAPPPAAENSQAIPSNQAKSDVPPLEQGEPLAEIVIEHSPPWLFSMAFHMLLMIVMGMIVYVNIPEKPINLNAEARYAENLGKQLEIEAPLGAPEPPTTAEASIITPENLPPVPDPLAAPPQLTARPDGTNSTSDIAAPQIGMALSGREEGSRKALVRDYGGDETTEAAVNRGLEWLAKHQRKDGSWSLLGPYAGGVPYRDLDNPASATGMALLAFQGAGNTHQGGKFKRNVANAWKWLLEQQDASGSFFKYGMNSHRFYTHAQCTIAACELFAMTRDEKYRRPAQAAIDYILRTQSPEGGWRYNPNIDTDISVTGWVVMALQSARMAGLEVPDAALSRVGEYLDRAAQYGGSRYPYQINGDVRLSMTAEALLMRQYLGWRRDDPRLADGVEWITSPENLIDFNRNRNVYYWYYATQVAHHFEGEQWKRWNKVMKQTLPKQQVARGKEAGSWDPDSPTPDQWASSGGRLYVTCLSICMLEVYYRYMPLYSRIVPRVEPPPPEKPKDGT
jgi:hypothetical protein